MRIRLAWFVLLIVAASVISTYVFVFGRAIEREKRSLVFEMTEKELVRKGTGGPDVRIGFSEIRALAEGPSRLVVASDSPPRKIAIPKTVDGYEELRAELAKLSSVDIVKHGLVPESTLLVSSLFCWGLVLWSKNRGMAEMGAAGALIIMAWGSFRLMSAFGIPQRRLVWIILGINWAAAILAVYFRAIHGW